MEIHALRLLPQEDLRQSIQQYAIDHDIQAGFVLSAIGSLTEARLRFAEQSQPSSGVDLRF